MKVCILDFETYSDVDLRDVGAYEYSMHPSTEIICVAFQLGTLKDFLSGEPLEVHSWSPLLRDRNLKAFMLFENALRDPKTILVAHNAFFDALILRNVFTRRMPKPYPGFEWKRWRCTMAMCQALALPRSLEDAAIALKLLEGKDKEGNRLVKKWCKPRKATKASDARRHLDLVQFNETAYAELMRIIEYCKSDIRVTADILRRIPLLSAEEQRLWEITQTINLRGFRVDRPLVQTILQLIAYEGKRLDAKLVKLTRGKVESGTKAAQLKQWICAEGYPVSDLQQKTVTAALKAPETPPRIKAVLRIRQARSMSSTAKYERFEAISQVDGRARGGIVYHAASTGRWGGSLLNPQNFPRGTIRNSIQAAEIVADGDPGLVRLIYGNPMAVYSSCLRTMIIPSEGNVFDVADYAQIEVRVLFWMAGHQKGLEVFKDKSRDIYKEAASGIFKMHVADIDKEGFERFTGKEQILGCGFGMGWKKFQQGMADKGRPISDELAKRVVDIYRRSNVAVVRMWYALEEAAIKATVAPGRKVHAARCVYESDGAFLYCTLPSGRRLAYQEPKVRLELKFGEKKHVLYHWTVDPRTKKRIYTSTYGGKLTENVVQATARDIMAHAKVSIEASGVWQLVLSVHDELISERSRFTSQTVDDYIALMKSLPKWAEGCPIEASGWSGDRYRK